MSRSCHTHLHLEVPAECRLAHGQLRLRRLSLHQRSISDAASTSVVKVKCAYDFAEKIARLKAGIAAKGIIFFSEIDQARLAV